MSHKAFARPWGPAGTRAGKDGCKPCAAASGCSVVAHARPSASLPARSLGDGGQRPAAGKQWWTAVKYTIIHTAD